MSAVEIGLAVYAVVMMGLGLATVIIAAYGLGYLRCLQQMIEQRRER